MDGLKQMMLDLYNLEVIEVDTLISEDNDLTNDEFYEALIQRCRDGEFFATIIGTPCGTFSVARIRVEGKDDDGPPQLRSEAEVLGISSLSPFHRKQVEVSDLLVKRSVAIARAVKASGGQFIIENPITRSDPSTNHYRWRWRSHASLWMHPEMKGLLGERSTRRVDFPQCALSGEWQKFTTLAYSVDLEPYLAKLGMLTCTHERHKKQAVGRDPDGKWKSAAAAAYPAAMNALFVETCVETMRRFGLHVGSAKPHASSAAEADEARPNTRPKPTPSSIRRLEPEVVETLRKEAFPAANEPPDTEWAEAPAMPADAPAPMTTKELMPPGMKERLGEFRRRVGACFDAARRGRWRWARDNRPDPLHATEAECLNPAARGWVWAFSTIDLKWHPLRPSSWPDDPPPGEIEAAIVVQYAREHGFSDMEIVSYMAHGFPAPEMARETVIGPPHVGALKSMEALDKATGKDRERGWVKFGYLLPPMWPMRADPMNIAWRHGKGRLTTDKSMQLVPGVDSYNECVDLDAMPSIEYVSVAMLGRATSILLSANVPVKVWGFDLEAYFRKTGKQRFDVWKSGFCLSDGYGVDERIQFGQREAPVLTGRQSCFLVWAIRREIRKRDAEFPVRDARLREWLEQRAANVSDESTCWWQRDTLSFVLMFVDDVGAASIDDPLFFADGRPWMVERGGETVQMTRAWMHYETAIELIREFGHTDAEGKGVTPADRMLFLGVTLDVDTRLMSLSEEKCESYKGEIQEALGGTAVNGSIAAPAHLMTSLMHKLLHASSVIPLGRQHMFHIMKAMRIETALAGGAKPLGKAAIAELEWWAEMLDRDMPKRGVPMAVRSIFPDPTAEGVVVSYSDASRELTNPTESGFGAWAVIAGEVLYIEGRWSDKEAAELDINTLELAAMDMGSFTFMKHARLAGVEVTHLYEFTDNTSAEASAERGKPKSEKLGRLITRRYDALYKFGVAATATRVTSVDNDIADGLSRGGEQLAQALRLAAAAGYPIRRVEVDAEWRDLSHLLSA